MWSCELQDKKRAKNKNKGQTNEKKIDAEGRKEEEQVQLGISATLQLELQLKCSLCSLCNSCAASSATLCNSATLPKRGNSELQINAPPVREAAKRRETDENSKAGSGNGGEQN